MRVLNILARRATNYAPVRHAKPIQANGLDTHHDDERPNGFGQHNLSAHDQLRLGTQLLLGCSFVVVNPRSNQTLTVALVIPARNEAPRLGHVLETVISDPRSIFDEIIVVDDGSTDNTADVARRHQGVHVLTVSDDQPGKGKALRAGWYQTRADIVVTCDADLGSLQREQLGELVFGLVRHEGLRLSKAAYDNSADSSGRVTELVAKPLLEIFYPTCADLVSPLSGEMAFYHRDVMTLDLPTDYGVDIALLISIAQRYGRQAITEIPFGVKQHPHQPLSTLSQQSRQVIRALFASLQDPYEALHTFTSLSWPAALSEA
jgi:glucosyl-3-phosphoglycerate synthase